MNFETRPYIVGSISRPRLIALRITVHVLWKRVIASHVRWACYLAFYDSTRRYITLSYVNTCASASVSRVTTRHRRACKISRTSTWRNYLFEKRNPARPICWRRNIATMRKISRRNSYLWIRSIILFSFFLVWDFPRNDVLCNIRRWLEKRIPSKVFLKHASFFFIVSSAWS